MKLCKDCKTFEYYIHHDMEPCKHCEHFHIEWIPGVNYSELGVSCSAKVSCDLKEGGGGGSKTWMI